MFPIYMHDTRHANLNPRLVIYYLGIAHKIKLRGIIDILFGVQRNAGDAAVEHRAYGVGLALVLSLTAGLRR